MSLATDKKIHYIQLLILSVIIIFVAFTIIPLSRYTERRMNNIKKSLIHSLEDSIGYKIHYDSISPSIFSFISIKNLTIFSDDGTQEVLAQIQSFKAFYSLFFFLGNNMDTYPLQAVRSFTITNAAFRINEQRDSKLISFLSKENSINVSFLPLKTRVRGRNVSVSFVGSKENIRGENLFFSLIPEQNNYRIKLKGNVSSLNSNIELPVKQVKTVFEAKGNISEYFDSLNMTVSSEGLTTDIADFTDQDFQFIYTKGLVEIRKVQDDRPIDLVLRFDTETQDLFVSFKAENFRPDSLVYFKGDFARFSLYSSSLISGTGSILYNMNRQEAVYSLDSRLSLNRNVLNRPLTLNTNLTGNMNQINVRNLDVTTTEGKVFFSGNIQTDNLFPEGTIRIYNFQIPGYLVLNSTLKVSHKKGFLTFTSPEIDLGTGKAEDFKMLVYPEVDQITASINVFLPNGEKDLGEISVDSLFTLGDKKELNSYISLKSLPFSGLKPLLPVVKNYSNIPDHLKDTNLSSDLTFQTDFDNFTLFVNQFELFSNSNLDNQVSFSGSYSNSGFKINDLDLEWDDYKLNGYINSSMDDSELMVSTHFDLQDKPYRIDARYTPGQLLVEGDYGLYAYFSYTADQLIDFKINSNDLPIPVGKQSFVADINGSGNFGNGVWNLLLENTKIRTDKILTLHEPELEFSARMDNQGADLYEIFYRDSVSSLKGLGRISYEPDQIISWLSFFDKTGKSSEQYNLYLSSNKGVWDSKISVVSAPVERLGESGLTGEVSVDFGFSGTKKNPRYEAQINSEKMNWNGSPVEISSYISGTEDRLRISDLKLNINKLMFNRGLLMIDLAQGKLAATGSFNQVINNSRASASLSAILTSDKSLDIFSLPSLIESNIEGKISTSPITWDGLKTFPGLQMYLKKEGDLIAGSIDDGDTLNVKYNVNNGDLRLHLGDLFPFPLEAEGSIYQSNVDIAVSNLLFKTSFLNYFMPIDPFKNKRVVVFKNGDVSGNFRIVGPISDPDYNGSVYINNLITESPFLAEIPDEISFSARLNGHSIDISPFTIALNDGGIDVVSSFEFDEALPTTYLVDCKLTGGAGARIAYEIPGFSWDGHFTGPVHLEGSRAGGFLKGDLICNDLKSSLRSDAEVNTNKKKIRNPSVNGFTVDLTVKTGRDVNFYLPNQEIPIIQAIAEKDDSINIAYDSRSDELSLVGKVDVRTGEINYFNKTFYLQEGYIDFNESQISFNPRINVKADVLTQDELGQDVTISLLFDDYLKNEFKPEFLSFPRKTENEILALLGQSFIPSNDPDQVSVASLLVATGGMIGKTTIMKPFEEAIKNTLNLDFVSFNTNIIENAILDRLGNQSIYDESNGVMNVARYLEDTSLFIGQYIGDYLFLEGSLVVDYDGSHSVTSTFGGLKLNVNLNLQFITPFVLIDWTYDPNTNPDSNHFIPQNTISLTWQYSY